MNDENKTTHVTAAGENIFLDLGFDPIEAAILKDEADKVIASRLSSKKLPEFKD